MEELESSIATMKEELNEYKKKERPNLVIINGREKLIATLEGVLGTYRHLVGEFRVQERLNEIEFNLDQIILNNDNANGLNLSQGT